ncbi:unnamed protein product [Penicillium glandicola]
MSDPKTSTEALEEISRHGLESSNLAEAIITDVEHLASYNWIEAPKPTIAVPGSPALWSAPQGSRQVKKDSGFVYIAQNAARHPDSPLEPLFRALYIEKPSFDINSIDVVTDRNNVRKLLSFVNPTQSRYGLEAFTIEVDMTAQTAIFCRAETATYEVIGPGEFRGFGREFEKSYTINQVRDSTGHHRIISYRLSGLSFLVRHETDGYVGDSKPGSKDDTGDDLAKTLHSLSLTPETTATVQASVKPKLTINREGQVVPRELTLEIKTRVVHKPMAIPEVAAQLWISQTPKLVRAYHQRGIFPTPKVEDVTTEIKDWERTNQDDIKKLVEVINRILRVTRNWVIKKVERKKMFPDDLYARWNKTIPVKAE